MLQCFLFVIRRLSVIKLTDIEFSCSTGSRITRYLKYLHMFNIQYNQLDVRDTESGLWIQLVPCIFPTLTEGGRGHFLVDPFSVELDLGELVLCTHVIKYSIIHELMQSCTLVLVFMYLCLHVLMFMYSCTQVHVLMCSCTGVLMYIYIHVLMYLCAHLLMYLCTHVLIYSCTHVLMYSTEC